MSKTVTWALNPIVRPLNRSEAEWLHILQYAAAWKLQYKHNRMAQKINRGLKVLGLSKDNLGDLESLRCTHCARVHGPVAACGSANLPDGAAVADLIDAYGLSHLLE